MFVLRFFKKLTIETEIMMFIVLQRKSLKQNEDLLFKKRYKGNQGKLIFINFLVFQFIKKKGKGPKGTSTKDPGTKPKWGRMEGGRWGGIKQWQ